MSFTEQLQAARNAAGLSQSQAALAMGRPVSILRKWEQGVNVPHPTIQAVALAALKKAENTDYPDPALLTNRQHFPAYHGREKAAR